MPAGAAAVAREVAPAAARPGPAPAPSRVYAVAAALLVVVLVVVAAAAFAAPLSYDAAYNLQVAQHLAHDGRYATDGALHGGTVRDFDAYITTGPTVLLPTGAVLALLGDHLWVTRLVPLAWFLALVGLAGTAGHRLAGRWGALAAAAGVLGVNLAATQPASPVFGVGDVVGEYAAAALLLAGVLRLAQVRDAGVLLGLAVLTKLLVLAFWPAFVVAVLLRSWHEPGLRARLRPAVVLTSWAAVPLLAWQLVRVAVLSPRGYASRAADFVEVFTSRGGAVAAPTSDDFVGRLGWLLRTLQPSLWLLVPLALVAVVSVLLRHRGTVPGGHALLHRPASVAVTLGAGALAFWWLTLAQWSLTRHLMPAVLVGVPWCLALLVAHVQGRPEATDVLTRWLRMCLQVAVPATCLLAAAMGWHAIDNSLSDQRVVAAAVRSSGADQISVLGWWQVPEIAYLARTPARPLTAAGGLLVIATYNDAHPDLATARALCSGPARTVGPYLLCEVAPTNPAAAGAAR